MTIAATTSLRSALPPFKFSFHPIGVGTIDTNWKDFDQTEGTCTSSVDALQEDEAIDMDGIAPYPAYTTTSEEIQGWKELETSLGDNWSTLLSCELSPCEMSLDGTAVSDVVEEEENLNSSFAFDDESMNESTGFCFEVEENEETRRNRNLLWKQSLKRSLFTSCR